MILASARRHYRQQQELTAKGLTAARRARFGPLGTLVGVVALFQVAGAKETITSSDAMLAEQGIDSDRAGVLVPAALAGVASDGRLLGVLLDLTRAPDFSDYQFDRVVLTQLQDASRSAGAVSVAATPAVSGYVRMLNPPSCSRCAVMAGREYRWNAGFERHPMCDCRHVPASEDTWDSLTTDPKAYFESLPTAADIREQYPDLTIAELRKRGVFSQEDVFTKAGARAVREGADIGRVVNARRGMRTAQMSQRGWIPKGRMAREEVFGRQLYTTTAGRGGRRVRLMPESIFEIAENREDAIRLLKAHGYIR